MVSLSTGVPEDLLAFGLTEHQALAYRTLVQLRTATAREVADAGNIPRNRAYEVLQALQEMGLVDVTLDEKRRFTPKPLGPYVDKVLGSLASRATALREAREALLARYAVSDGDGDGLGSSGQIRMVRGRQANVQAIVALVDRATRRVEAVIDGTTLKLLVATPGFLEALARLHRAGARVLLLVPVMEETRKPVEEARAVLGGAVRALPSPNPPMVSRFVCDGTLHFCQRATPVSSQTLGLTTDHGVLVADAEGLVEEVRLQSVDAADRLADLYEGRPPAVEVFLREPAARDERLIDAIRGAKVSLEFFGAPTGLPASVRDDLRTLLEARGRAGVRVRALALVGADTLDDVEGLLGSAEVRHAAVGGAGTWTLLVDRSRVLEFLGSTAVDSTVSSRVALLSHHFDDAWVSATRLEDRRRALTRGTEAPSLMRAVPGAAAAWETLRAALAGARERVLLVGGERLRGPRGESLVDLLDGIPDAAVEVRLVSWQEASPGERVPKRIRPRVKQGQGPPPGHGSALVDGEDAFWWAAPEDGGPQPLAALVVSRDPGTVARAERAFERAWSGGAAGAAKGAPAGAPLRVLVVADDSTVQEMVGRYLQEMPGRGVEVATAGDAAAALSMVEAERFDAVISDYRLKDGDGVVVLERVRALSPGTVRVLLTGYREMRIAREAVNRAQISLLLEKPFHRDDLLSRLTPLLEAKSEEASRNREVARALYAAAAHLSLLDS